MNTYRIIAKTNPYIAQRDVRIFNGKTQVVLHTGLSLEAAQAKLTEMGEEDYDGDFDLFFHDANGMSYEYDSRYFYIEEEIQDEMIFTKNTSKTFEVTYTKKVGGNGTIIVKAENEEQALKNAKYLCFTGSDFRGAVIVEDTKYSKPRKQGFQGSQRA